MSDGFDYVWVDTCCIDKTSSAELSEAINSMYVWYRGADVCYVYMADVVDTREDFHSQPGLGSAFGQSRWWTRGWTLQELLAPTCLTFFDQNWREIGTKASLQELISDLTGIDAQTLLDYDANRSLVSVAQKMSWAANRQTTRREDHAYCLLGIFGINMPLLYGEGNQAFRRLQLEILKQSTDHSLFAWKGGVLETGLLAYSPANFADCGSVREVVDNWIKSPYEMTNKGLRINLRFKWILDNSSYYDRPRECGRRGEVQILAILDCQRKDQQETDYTMLAIRVREVSEGIFARVYPDKIENLEAAWIRRADDQQVYFLDRLLLGSEINYDVKNLWAVSNFSVKKLAVQASSGYTLVAAFPDLWKGMGEGMRLGVQDGDVVALLFRNNTQDRRFLVVLGLAGHDSPWCDIVSNVQDDDLLKALKPLLDSAKNDDIVKLNRTAFSQYRVSKHLPGGLTAYVAVRKGRMRGEVQYLVEITVKLSDDSSDTIPSRFDKALVLNS